MITTDPIADMLTRMRNAISNRSLDVEVPASKIKVEIAKILLAEGYVAKIESTKNKDGKDMIKITFKQSNGSQRVIQGLRRISKPGLRIYVKAEHLPKVLSGLGIAIISTSKGILTDRDARNLNIGGEVLAYVW